MSLFWLPIQFVTGFPDYRIWPFKHSVCIILSCLDECHVLPFFLLVFVFLLIVITATFSIVFFNTSNPLIHYSFHFIFRYSILHSFKSFLKHYVSFLIMLNPYTLLGFDSLYFHHTLSNWLLRVGMNSNLDYQMRPSPFGQKSELGLYIE